MRDVDNAKCISYFLSRLTNSNLNSSRAGLYRVRKAIEFHEPARRFSEIIMTLEEKREAVRAAEEAVKAAVNNRRLAGQALESADAAFDSALREQSMALDNASQAYSNFLDELSKD